MGRRNDLQRRCTQAKDLIQENKYVPALEIIDTIPLEEVSSIEDLYLFADLYEKAEKLNKKKEIFLMIYNRTHSRRILKRLIRLTIRMGDVEEARQLFLAYEMNWEVTLDTFELRYLLARAEGEPRTKLIEILEELKQEEYTEKWGFQLARLYELEGEREKCIRECKDVKLWFGEGRIVDKAAALREQCESPDWQPPGDMDIPEPELLEEDILNMKESLKEDMTDSGESGEMEVLDPGEQPEEREVLGLEDVPELQEVLEPEEQPQVQEVLEPEQTQKQKSILGREEPQVNTMFEAEEEEETEDISERGIRYYTIKSTIAHMRKKEGNPHIVFAGGEERIVLTVSKRMAKELRRLGYFSAKNFAKTTAGKLNKLNLADQMTKLEGSCLLILEAPSMSKKTVKSLTALIEEHGDRIVVMLSGDFDEMDCFLSIYPELSEKLLYKIHM